MYKDLGLALEVAKVAGKNILPVGSTVHDIYGDLVKQGLVRLFIYSFINYNSLNYDILL